MNKATKIGLLSSLASLAVCGVGAGTLFFRNSSAVVEERTAARKIGIPLTLAEIGLVPIPDDQNAGVLYRRIAVFLSENDRRVKALKALSHQKPANPFKLRSADEFQKDADDSLPGLKPMFDMLGELRSRPKCDFGSDWINFQPGSFNEFTTLKAIVKDLCARADFEDRQGDPQKALQSMTTAYRVAVDSGTPPNLIAMFVEVACRSIANKELQSLVSRHASDLAFLNKSEDLLNANRRLPDMRWHLRGEIVFNLKSIHELTGLPRTQTVSEDSMSTSERAPSKLETSFVRSKAFQDAIEAKLLSTWRETWTHFPKDSQDWDGFSRALKLTSATVMHDSSTTNSILRELFPTYDGAPDVIGRLQAHDRSLKASIELLKLRIQNGKLPVVLPSSLGVDRLDPFDGNPLRYMRRGSGFLLYSIGADRMDDGGHVRASGDREGAGVDEVVEFK